MSKEKKFEENLADLEVIVQKLENGDVALEEAIAEFQKGRSFQKNFRLVWTRLKRPWLRSCRQTAQKRKWNDKKRETGKDWSDD